jgi:hypothetical protein
MLRIRHPGRRPAGMAAAVALLAVADPSFARVNVATLPGRDSVQLTIYNPADLTMVRETRALTFRRGLNRLEFSWANTLIDPTSVEFRAVTHAGRVEVLDVSFPPRVTNTLEWRIHSQVAGEVEVEILYFTSGINWSADYIAETDRLEQSMNLTGHVRVTNHSGEDYPNAQVRLVVGVIRLVEEIADLARPDRLRSISGLGVRSVSLSDELWHNGRLDFRRALERAEDRLGQIVKEGVSEYFLYTVQGRDTIPTGWSKRLPFIVAAGLPVASYYKFERQHWGERVLRHYRFVNDAASRLGAEPLPDGVVHVFQRVSADGLLAFVGRAQAKYVPVGEQAEWELGADQQVRVEPRLMNWEKTDLRFDQRGNVAGWTIVETWEIELQHSRDIPITLDLRQNFSGDWELQAATVYDKLDASKVRFLALLPPRGKQTLRYRLTTRHGTNATR